MDKINLYHFKTVLPHPKPAPNLSFQSAGQVVQAKIDENEIYMSQLSITSHIKALLKTLSLKNLFQSIQKSLTYTEAIIIIILASVLLMKRGS